MERLGASTLRCEGKEEAVMADIASYVSHEVSRLAIDRKLSPEMQQTIRQKLVEGSQGIFLWTSLMVHRLSRTPNRLMAKVLSETPPGVSGMYERILADIPQESKEVAFHILMWVTFSARPLTLTELNVICELKFKDSDTFEETELGDLGGIQAEITCCGPILKIRATSDEVLLVHDTARKFLVQYASNLSTTLLPSPEAHLQLAATCLDYISLDSVARASVPITFDKLSANQDHLSPFQRRHPFSRYAFSFWDFHLALSDMSSNTDAMWSKIRIAFQGRSCRELSSQFHAFSPVWIEEPGVIRMENKGRAMRCSEYVSGAHVLHLLSLQGLVPFLRLWLSSSEDKNCDVMDDSKRTPLLIAAAHGQREFVQLLVEQGHANVSHQDSSSTSALIAACDNGRDLVVEYLLQLEGINVDQRDSAGETALLRASRRDHGNIVRMLLERGKADMNIRSHNGWHPVFAASVAEAEKALLQLLYQQRARNADLDDDDWANIRDRAVNNGHVSVVREIHAHYRDKADLGRYGRLLISKGFTPLTFAAQYGETRMIRFLIDEAGMDVNERDSRGLAPIHSAARQGSVKGLQSVLDCEGVDIELQCKKGYPHLLGDIDSMAAQQCADRGLPLDEFSGEIGLYMLRLLLGHAKSKDQAAQKEQGAKMRERELAQFANVAMGLDPNHGLPPESPKPPRPRLPTATPMSKRGCHEHAEGMVFVLNAFYSPDFSQVLADAGELERSASPGPEEEKFWNAISDDYIHAPEDIGQSALHWACQNGHGDATRLLLKAGASVDNPNQYGDTPFCKAAAHGHINVAQLLLDTGKVYVNARDDAGKPEALIYAIENKHPDMVRFLLDNAGTDPLICDVTGGSPLHYAVIDGTAEIISILLQHGADPIARTSPGGLTPLSMAVETGSEEMVRCLLAARADPNETDGDGKSAVSLLFTALYTEMRGIASALLEAGADPFVDMPPSGDTPLVIAAAHGYTEIVTSIFNLPGATERPDFTGIYPDSSTGQCPTAVGSAALYGRLEVLDLLLSKGAAFDAASSSLEDEEDRGLTPLRKAVMGGFTEVVRRLLAAGADPTKVDGKGESVVDYARRLTRIMPQRGECLELLEAAVAAATSLVGDGKGESKGKEREGACANSVVDGSEGVSGPVDEVDEGAEKGGEGKMTLPVRLGDSASGAMAKTKNRLRRAFHASFGKKQPK
ncbi:Ankyrin repeat-containing domain protein [Naviculisporaceae sp. PSN 640]